MTAVLGVVAETGSRLRSSHFVLLMDIVCPAVARSQSCISWIDKEAGYTLNGLWRQESGRLPTIYIFAYCCCYMNRGTV